MITFINDSENKKQKFFPFPKKPSSSLPKASKSSKLLGKELHLYLKEKISRDNIDAANIPEEKTFESLKLYLKICAEYEKTINKKSLEFHLQQGKFLEQLHSLWIEKRAKGLVSLNWND